MGPSGALYKSTDGGLTFTVLTLSATGVPANLNAQVVAVNPADADEVLVAGNSEGFILRSTDGGSCSSMSGFDAIECDLDLLDDADLCGSDTIHPRLKKLVTKKVRKARSNASL